MAAPAASTTASYSVTPLGVVTTAAPRGDVPSAYTGSWTTARPARATRNSRTASTSTTPPLTSSSATSGTSTTGSRSRPEPAPSNSWLAPAWAIAAARSAMSVPVTTHPLSISISRLASWLQRSNWSRARCATRTSTGSAWASRKIRVEPAERAAITRPGSLHVAA